MQVLLENGYVVSYAIVGELNDSIEVDFSEEDLPHFEENYLAYRYDGEKLVFDEEKAEDLKLESKREEIRKHRSEICFPIVNRGGLWYDLLTEEEKADLLDWYQAWLDATETMIEPDMPEWLKER